MIYCSNTTFYSYWDDGTSLYHHGILGQKWGRRNGPPYPLGEEDHSSAEKKAGWKKSLKEKHNARKNKRATDIDSVKKQHKKNNPYLTDEEAERFAKNVVNISDAGRALLTAGLLAGGAMAVYATLHKDPYSSDFVIPSGGEIYRVQGKEHLDLPEGFFYATPDSHDAQIYKGGWGQEQNLFGMKGDFKNALTIGVNKDVKVAGMDAAKEAYNTVKNSPEFKAAVGPYNMYQYNSIEEFLKIAPMDKGNPDPFKVFQKELAKKGYAGVIDYNDKFGEGYRVKAPVILFNTNSEDKKDFSIKNIESLDKKNIAKYKRVANAHFAKIMFIPRNSEEVVSLALNASPLLAAYGFSELARNNAVSNEKSRAQKEASKKKTNKKS